MFLPQLLSLQRGGRTRQRFDLRLREIKPILSEATATTVFDRHYVFHTAWAARVLARTRPPSHVDLSSSLYFVGCVSAFVPITFLDYRPAGLSLDGVQEMGGDIHALPFADDSIPSLSSLHVVEHIGLGRYGDRIDYDGDIAACRELTRVLAPGGQLLFVVPIGATPRIVFNAHRIYSSAQVIELFKGLVLEEFSLISDDPADGGLNSWPSDELLSRQRYGCGCFLFRKPKAI